MIPRLIYDIESRSEIDLSERGLDNYARHPSTEIICATVATDNLEATAAFIDSPGVESEMRALGLNVISPDVLIATLRAAETLVASNVAFDQLVTKYALQVHIPKERWSCTMARAMRHGLPGALDNCAKVLNAPEGKDKEGQRLSKQLWKPRPTWTKKGTGPKWFDDAKRLARCALYNARDVRTSKAIDKLLPELEPAEREIWLHVWRMNARGIPLDMDLINGAIAINEQGIREITDRIREYTGGMVQSLKAPGQLVAWAARYGIDFPSWTKDEVTAALANPDLPEPVRVVAQARQEAARGSVAKFETAANMVSPDGRIRHQIVYAGTSTLRLAGRGMQPLNLPRPKLEAAKKSGLALPQWKLKYDPERALAAIQSGSLKILQEIGDPEEILSDNIRSAIKAPPGKLIASPDLSAIEARGVFWISDCNSALQAYRRKEDLYCTVASKILGYAVNKDEHPEQRQNYGKVPVLSCGYGAGVSTIALKNKISEDVASEAVHGYRTLFPEVKRAWYDLENAGIEAIRNPGHKFSCCRNRVHFIYSNGWLQLTRPSGTIMYLPDAGLDAEGRLYYHAWIKGEWYSESIWGGVLMNFVVQGFSRELMYEAELKIARDPRFELVLQCYDSLTALVNEHEADSLCQQMIAIMETPPLWAPDLPLVAEGKPKERYG